MYWLSLGLIPLLSLFDRVRGGQRFGLEGTPNKVLKYISQFGLGLFPALFLTNEPILWVLGSVFLWLGEKPSWRQIYNELSGLAVEEEFLFGRFMLRGLVWSILPALLSIAQVFYFNEAPTFLAYLVMVLAMPLGSYWGYRWQHDFGKHAFTEWSRGAIFGGLVSVVVICLNIL